MSALAHALVKHVVRGAQVLDRPALSTTTSSAAFSIVTTINAPFPNGVGVDGVSEVMTSTATAAAALVATATAIMATGSSKDGGADDDNGDCRLLGPFAVFVQLLLGGLALLALVYKRWRERPQRPVKIWFFDVSKQVFGSVLVHIANVFMSMLTSGRFSIKVEPGAVATVARTAVGLMTRTDIRSDEYVPNPCSFYLLNLAIDTTIGIPILILLLRIFTGLVSYTRAGQPPESIQSGNYGSPPNAWWWLKQSVIYFCGLFGMKFCVLIIFLMLPWISRVGDWALSWTEGNEKVQIVFVMMLFPLIMNALQYYIIDSFIKMQTPSKDSEEGSERRPTGGSYQRISNSGSEEGHVDHERRRSQSAEVEDETDVKVPPSQQVKKTSRPGHEEYDPELDGDRTTVVGSASTTRAEGGVPRELLPKE